MTSEPHAFLTIDQGAATASIALIGRVAGTWRLIGSLAFPAGAAIDGTKLASIDNAGLITVVIGPLIKTKGRDAADVNAEVEGWIEGEMRVISPERYAVS